MEQLFHMSALELGRKIRTGELLVRDVALSYME